MNCRRPALTAATGGGGSGAASHPRLGSSTHGSPLFVALSLQTSAAWLARRQAREWPTVRLGLVCGRGRERSIELHSTCMDEHTTAEGGRAPLMDAATSRHLPPPRRQLTQLDIRSRRFPLSIPCKSSQWNVGTKQCGMQEEVLGDSMVAPLNCAAQPLAVLPQGLGDTEMFSRKASTASGWAAMARARPSADLTPIWPSPCSHGASTTALTQGGGRGAAPVGAAGNP